MSIRPTSKYCLLSPLLVKHEIIHGFTQAHLSHTNPIEVDTLDFSPNQDTSIIHNHISVIKAELDCKRQVLTSNQVHGTCILHITEEHASLNQTPVWHHLNLEADALISERADILLGIRTADCLPILVASQDGQLVMVIHAGWRGIAQNIISRSINLILEKIPAAQLLAAIGPGISVNQFEVGHEVLEEMRDNVKEKLVWEQKAKPHINLAATAINQLHACGLATHNIDHLDYCTFSDKHFFSYRRDGKQAGRMLSLIGVKT